MSFSKGLFFYVIVFDISFACKSRYDAKLEYNFVYHIRNLLCPTSDDGEANIEAIASYIASVASNSIQIELSSFGGTWEGFSQNSSWKSECTSLDSADSKFSCLMSARRFDFNKFLVNSNLGLFSQQQNRSVHLKNLVYECQITISLSGKVSIIEVTAFRKERIYSNTVPPMKLDSFYEILLQAIKTVNENTFCMIPRKF